MKVNTLGLFRKSPAGKNVTGPPQSRKEIGEVTKIISAHLAGQQAADETKTESLEWSEYDSLTGLSSFSRFRTELERLIIGKYIVSDYLLYIDFSGFKYFNEKYGYSRGDQILKEFSSYFINEIEEAIKENRFQVYFQPKVSLNTGEVIGAEALVRWQTKEGKILLPSQFIPVCESTDRIEELDFYVFERAVAFPSQNQKLGRKQLPVSVNISILHASDHTATKRFRSILDRYGVNAEFIEIELTETATVKKYEDAKHLFRELQDAGIHTAIDDFGAGYSVLNSIIDIPVNTMNLDYIFIKNCTASEHGISLLQGVVKMIKDLGYHLVCEGIETESQDEILYGIFLRFFAR